MTTDTFSRVGLTENFANAAVRTHADRTVEPINHIFDTTNTSDLSSQFEAAANVTLAPDAENTVSVQQNTFSFGMSA